MMSRNSDSFLKELDFLKIFLSFSDRETRIQNQYLLAQHAWIKEPISIMFGKYESERCQKVAECIAKMPLQNKTQNSILKVRGNMFLNSDDRLRQLDKKTQYLPNRRFGTHLKIFFRHISIIPTW